MSGIAGYKAQIKLGGPPTMFDEEPLEQLGISNLFRIVDPVKRVLSAENPLSVFDFTNAPVLVDRVNYLEGIIQITNFEDYDLPFNVTGDYIPVNFIAGAKDYSLDIGGDVLDNTSFHDDVEVSAGYRTKVNGIHDISCSFSLWYNFNNQFTSQIIAKTPIFVSINPGSSKVFIKGWFQIENDSLSGDIGSLQDEAISLVLSQKDISTCFSYCYHYTLLECDDLTQNQLLDNYFLQAPE